MTGLASPRRRIGRDAAGAVLPVRIDDRRRFRVPVRARSDDIDELSHIDNATWASWVLIERASRRPIRIAAEVAAPFLFETAARESEQ